MKYAVAVDHKAYHSKSFTYLKLENTDKAMAFAEGAVKGFAQENVFAVHILKQVRKNTFASIALIHADGSIGETNTFGTFTIFEQDFAN